MKIVIVGAGDVGSFLAHDLSKRSEDVIIIDDDATVLESVEEGSDVMTLKGNGTYRKTLIEAGVKNADLVVGVTSHDDTNMVITSLANQLGAKRTVARVDAPEFFSTKGGIERNVLGSFAIVCASRLVSAELLRLVRRIDMPFVQNFSSNTITVALIEVNESCRHLEKAGSDLDLGKDAKVIGIFRDGELRRPIDLAHLYNGDRILVATPLKRLPVVMRRLVQVPGKKAVIIGGGDVGYQLATSLEDVENRLTVIDIDRRRCEFLADNLNHTTVVHGDGTSLALLQDEHVEMADYTLSVTKADEVNLMSSLVAQEIGVSNSYTLVHRPGYAHVYEHLGVKGTASAHEMFSKIVNKYFPNQIVLSHEPIPDTEYMVGEFQLPTSIRSGSLKIKDLQLPMSSYLVGIERNENFHMADSDTDIIAEDILVLVCKQSEMKQIEHVVKKVK
ncbi:MAG: Trk system potassium transporter TrkA [Bdellovibrionales bacterium]|nr:Trk system potassium transporter TrkA [Bdellovibrionales bacterium]NQZ18063.1 Trk system potassium transporter TrkA [Bdellovibrionales bacterium]